MVLAALDAARCMFPPRIAVFAAGSAEATSAMRPPRRALIWGRLDMLEGSGKGMEYDAREVLDRYVTALGKSAGAVVRDVSAIGYPKDSVKFVLQHCMRTFDSKEQREFLQDAYLSLASFQELTDDERKAAVQLNEIWPTASSPEANGHVGEAAAPLHDVLARIRAETIVLTQELKTLPGADTAA